MSDRGTYRPQAAGILGTPRGAQSSDSRADFRSSSAASCLFAQQIASDLDSTDDFELDYTNPKTFAPARPSNMSSSNGTEKDPWNKENKQKFQR